MAGTGVRAITYGESPKAPGNTSDRLRMLRITIHEGSKVQTIQLEGKIAGPWVEELGCTWHSLAPSLGSKQLYLDLRGVAFVDAKGRQLLRADSPLTQYLADNAMQQSPNQGEEGA